MEKLEKTSEPRGWIGPAISSLQVATIMGLAATQSVVTAVSPVLLAEMARQGALLNSQIGQVATVEYLTLAISTALAGVYWRPTNVRVKMLVVAILFTALNAFSSVLSFPLILVVRGLAGFCEGAFIWLMLQMFARSHVPARLQGIFLAVQGVAGFIASLMFANFLIPSRSFEGGFLAMALISATGIAGVLLLPKSFGPLPEKGEGGSAALTAGWPALLATFVVFAGTLAIWLYIPALAEQYDLPPYVVGLGVPAAIILQVAGGLAASAMSGKVRYELLLCVSWVSIIGLAAILITNPPAWAFLGLIGAFGFLWMFYIPFTLSFAVDLDPTRRSLSFLGAVQPLGAAAGPLLASLAVSAEDVSGAFTIGCVCFASGLAILALSRRRVLNRKNSRDEVNGG